MTRAIASMIGIGLLIGGGIFLIRLLQPTESPSPPKKEEVLTGAYAPVLVEYAVLQDHELPQGIEPPGVGSDVIYLQLIVQYPGAASVPEVAAHKLDRVQRGGAPALTPVHAEAWDDEGGPKLALVFRTLASFRSGRLMRGETVVLEDFRIE